MKVKITLEVELPDDNSTDFTAETMNLDLEATGGDLFWPMLLDHGVLVTKVEIE